MYIIILILEALIVPTVSLEKCDAFGSYGNIYFLSLETSNRLYLWNMNFS